MKIPHFKFSAIEIEITAAKIIHRGVKVAPKSKEPLTVMTVVDIMLASPHQNTSCISPEDGVVVLSKVKKLLSQADVTFGNIEGSLINDGVSGKYRPSSTQCFAFKTPTHYAKYLQEAGFDVLSLANNHAGDFWLRRKRKHPKNIGWSWN